jgi:hypothetical protein
MSRPIQSHQSCAAPCGSLTWEAMWFLPGLLAESRRAGPDEPGIEVPMRDHFSLDHRVDLLKIDIEGGEW